MTPRVSVVSTVYNGAPYFDRAIPGILAQTFDDFEFVIVDDGSTDGTAKVRKRASSSERVVSHGNSKQVSRYTIRLWSASGSSRRISRR